MDQQDDLLPPAGQQIPGQQQAGQHNLPNLHLPEFWPENPVGWFRMAEAQFRLRNVTAGTDKYCFVLGALSRDAYRQVADVVDRDPDQNSYAEIKESLLASHRLSDFQKVEALAKMEPLGGRKPTQLLAEMLELCPRGHENSPFFAYFYLQRLPREMRVQMSEDDQADLRALAKKANGLTSLHAPQQHEVAAVAPAAADELADGATVAAVAKGKPAGKSRSKFGKRAGQQESTVKLPLCWYHAKFGAKASRCGGDCSWPAEN